MKKWSKKVWMSAAAVLIAIMSVSAIPASAEVSRVVYFTIQNNMRCQAGADYNNLIINLNNISNYDTVVKVQLYKDDGSEFNLPGAGTSSGYKTNFTPGTSFVLAPKASGHYIVNFGYTFNACSERPAFGKITVESDSGLLLANGETRAANTSAETIHESPIIINNGNHFNIIQPRGFGSRAFYLMGLISIPSSYPTKK